jgi:hypothetical protein
VVNEVEKMLDHKQETKECKKQLKIAGYPVTSVRRGSGTAWGWIDVDVNDYRSVIVNGKYTDQYPLIKAILYKITGDDQHCVNFLKTHKCSECVISNCDKYHTPEMGSCHAFLNRELADLQYADMLKREEKARQEKIEGFKVEDHYDDTIRLTNITVNCGASVVVLKSRFEEMINQEKTKGEIFDLISFERSEEIKQEIAESERKYNELKESMKDQPEKNPKVKSIEITRAEGPSALCGVPKTFESFKDARTWLYSQSSTFPKGGCYDKHDFTITFTDGETYSGRLDCKHHLESDNDLDVYRHVLEFCTFYSGRAKLLPEHFKDQETYKAFLLSSHGIETMNNYSEFIDKYLLSPVVIA